MIYKKRWIYPLVNSAIKTFPAVVISGARQVGKSTFLQNEFADFKYLNLDDFSTLQQAKSDPASLWTGYGRVIIDEAQKAPELFPAIKSAIDGTQRKMRFLVSGSSNLLLMKNISESLAGRAVYFEMLPMSKGEMEIGHEQPRNFFKIIKRNHTVKEREIGAVSPFPFMFRGFMPPLMHLTDDKDVLLWWEGYIKTYIERDLREMSQIDSLIGFRRVMAALALRSGNLVNQTEISRDTGVSQPTVHRYLKLLEVSNIVRKVPPYHTNRTKRIMKSPKIFFIDPGLSAYLSGYHHREDLKNARESGAFFENMVFLHLTILSELMIPKAKIFYWRTTTGREADFVVEHGKTLVAFEAKLTNKPSFEDIKNLLAFIEEYPETTRGVLLHAGSSIKWLHSRVVAVPWWWIGE